jgi:hypothetical protein
MVFVALSFGALNGFANFNLNGIYRSNILESRIYMGNNNFFN